MGQRHDNPPANDLQDEALLPCPFCGAGTTQLHDNGREWMGQRYSEAVSVSVRHWCAPIEGQPSRMLERIGKDRTSAIAAWNMRTAPDLADPIAKTEESTICRCRQCLIDRNDSVSGVPTYLSTMVICTSCGSKRCAHAQDHRNPCSGSNS